jgi:hypothetical protein
MNCINQHVTSTWAMYNGDCVDVLKGIPDHSIGYSIFSPPFASLYTYSNSPRDMGNVRDHDEFFAHFGYLVDELLRVMEPCRDVSFHCMLMPTSKVRDGVIGLRDFRSELRQAFEEKGFILHSEVVIWKDPVTAMQRTKALGLLHKTVRTNAAMSRQGIPDYLVTMRSPGEPINKVTHDAKEYPVEKWQKIASPIWMDIDPNDTLQYRSARENDDERHICLASGSLVLTREHGYLEIEEVEPGDNVLTHMGRWMPVIAKRCNGISETVRVCAQGVADLRVTPDHKLWTRIADGSRPKEKAARTDPAWVEARSVLGSYLNQQLPPVEESELTADEWWIVGRWLGDGHRGGHRRSGIRGGLGQFYISCSHDETAELLARLGKHAGHAAKVTATQVALIGLRDVVRDVLNRCGEGACNKRLPGEAVTLCAELSEALLAGYLSADGHYVESHDRVMASSVSRGLLLGMSMIAQRARSVVASVYAGRQDRDGEIEGRAVTMRQDWIYSFRNSEGKKKSGWIDAAGAWKKVRKIEDVGESEVWDLQVAEDASFTAEGAVVHNCPLQLEVIRRGVELWTNPGDIVLSPFAGIGSEGYVATEMGRRFIGVELKTSYYDQAIRNIAQAGAQGDLFGALEMDAA